MTAWMKIVCTIWHALWYYHT